MELRKHFPQDHTHKRAERQVSISDSLSRVQHPRRQPITKRWPVLVCLQGFPLPGVFLSQAHSVYSQIPLCTSWFVSHQPGLLHIPSTLTPKGFPPIHSVISWLIFPSHTTLLDSSFSVPPFLLLPPPHPLLLHSWIPCHTPPSCLSPSPPLANLCNLLAPVSTPGFQCFY